MSKKEKRYRFLLMQPYHAAKEGSQVDEQASGQDRPEEGRAMDYDNVSTQRIGEAGQLLEDVEWDLSPGPAAPSGDRPFEKREWFCLVAASRLSLIREACESGKYNAIVLLGGADPGFLESREIARRFNIPVTAGAYSQMHIASMLGNRFSFIDIAEVHQMWLAGLVDQYHFSERCASIRNLNYPLPYPGERAEPSLLGERDKALRDGTSEAVEIAVREAVAAIEEDGAEVLTFGCSLTYWLQPFLRKRLEEMGWEVPVLEGYGCSLVLAKAMVDLKVDASGLLFPSDRPKKWRRKKVF